MIPYFKSVLAVTFMFVSYAKSDGPVCLYGEDFAKTPTGSVKIKNLKSGDLVLSSWPNGTLSFSPVLAQLHAENNATMAALQVRMHSGRHYTLTPEHIVLTSRRCASPMFKNVESKLADSLNISDCLFVISDNQPGVLELDKVEEIQRVYVRGVYNPVTREGTIVVNGILASCYAYLSDHYLMHSVFSVFHYLPPSGMPYIEQMFQRMSDQEFADWMILLSGRLAYSDEHGMCFRRDSK